MSIRIDASKSWIEGSLASQVETAGPGLVECSSDLVLEVNRRSVASFTTAAPHPLLYIRTTKPSIRCILIDSVPNMLGFNVSATNVSV